MTSDQGRGQPRSADGAITYSCLPSTRPASDHEQTTAAWFQPTHGGRGHSANGGLPLILCLLRVPQSLACLPGPGDVLPTRSTPTLWPLSLCPPVLPPASPAQPVGVGTKSQRWLLPIPTHATAVGRSMCDPAPWQARLLASLHQTESMATLGH
jgi:hypothetical protein